MRIYVDESGTHAEDFLIIGALFVPTHGATHSDLCAVKEEEKYFNLSTKRRGRYKETHFAKMRSPRDARVAKAFVDVFCAHDCYYRCVVIDWSVWDGRHFGTPFEPDALKKRRAYKKWAEMLLHPETRNLKNAELYLDKLRIMYGYDVIKELEERFTKNYQGKNPCIRKFQHTDSWRDANQCLQLCDVLTACVYQSQVPSGQVEKIGVTDHLYSRLASFGVRDRSASYWKGYSKTTLTQHFPKFSEWFWRPE